MTSVLDGYVGFYGAYEPGHQAEIDSLPKVDRHRISMKIGRGCVAAADGNHPAADRIFRYAQRLLLPFVDTPQKRRTPVGREASELHTAAQLLECRKDEEAVAHNRRTMHLKTITAIRRARDNLMRTDDHAPRNGTVMALSGELTQQVALGSISRMAEHPWVLAMPALLHHDRGGVGSKPHNFDMLLIETGPKHPSTNAIKVQIKTDCIGLCDDPQEVQVDRTEYAGDITFLSGCCDLGVRGNRYDPERYKVADMLMREADETAGADDILTLDHYTGNLLLSLTMGDPNRMGLGAWPRAESS